MWQEQVELGCVLYYFFVVWDIGVQDYFVVLFECVWCIFWGVYQWVSGVVWIVCGLLMLVGFGKVYIVGVSEVVGECVFILQFLQGCNLDWVVWLFFVKYDFKVIWLDDFYFVFGKEWFFFEEEYLIIWLVKFIKLFKSILNGIVQGVVLN